MGKSFCLGGIAKSAISNFNTTHRVRVIFADRFSKGEISECAWMSV